MTQYNPFLKLNRLTIYTKSGKIAYDQNFHEGVNIIRGHNSAGKSIIGNFIFYVLGGDFKKWTTAASYCNDVYAEVFINSEPITIKRTVSESGNQPMSIFWGTYDEALKSASEGWQIFPYRRTETKKSFSNALFLALGFPELRGDVDSNITMHQVLRMLYVDQKSLTLDLLMTENFDSSITRKTIADLLFGVYDDSLYLDKIALREAEKDFEVKKKQFEGIEQIFKASDNETNIGTINALIEENNVQIKSIDEYLEKLTKEQNDASEKTDEEELKVVTIKTNLLATRNSLSVLQTEINKFEFELLDSQDFIRSLEKRALALSDSLLTRETFIDLKMHHCPNCLSPLVPAVDDNHCELCKQQLPEDKGSSQIKRMQQEIDNQIRESKKLYLEKEHKLLEFKSSYPTLEQKVRALQRELDEALSSVKTVRNQEFDELLIKKGELRSKNDYLIKQLRALEQIEVLRKELAGLKIKIESLKTNINSKEAEQRNRLQNAFQIIQSLTLRLLHSDLGRQAEFSTGKKIELDFEKNTFSLDGENNFSESSNVYLKNSVRFAIFFASLQKDFFRLPRFVLCDNIEDKGMQPDRSQSFQKELVKISSESDVKHQIIITTSMISADLDNTELCVGDFYTETNKTLKIE
jgi:predicted transcriptional regulator with HTH domain